MGKNKAQAPWQWQRPNAYPREQQHSGHGKSWQYWPGAWSPRSKAAPPSRYDEMPTEEEVPRTTTAQPGLGSALSGLDTSILQAIHKALTQARRIDTRVRKIGEEKEKRTKQWEVYAKDMRQKYLKQQQVFQQDMEKLEQEEALARTAGADAAQLVTDIVNRRQRPAPVAVETGPDAWDQLLQTDMEVEEAHGFLAQAQAALSGVPRAPQTSVTAPLLATVGQNAPPGLPPPAGGATAPTSLPSSMPPTAGPAAVPATGMTGVDAAQHGYHALSPGNCTHRVEPFPASPMQTMPARPEEAKSTEPSGADAAKPESAEPPRRPAAPKRTPLKEQAKHSPPQTVTSGASLGQKLESKRAAMQATATLPFRVPPPGTAGPPEPPDTGEPPGPAPPAGIVNDDIEELNSASPGFGNLE